MTRAEISKLSRELGVKLSLEDRRSLWSHDSAIRAEACARGLDRLLPAPSTDAELAALPPKAKPNARSSRKRVKRRTQNKTVAPTHPWDVCYDFDADGAGETH